MTHCHLLMPCHSKPKHSIAALRAFSAGAPDPFTLVEKDIGSLSGGIKELLGSDHPVLESCAKYFFETDGGKKIRPTMVLAMSYALNASSPAMSPGKPPAVPAMTAMCANPVHQALCCMLCPHSVG